MYRPFHVDRRRLTKTIFNYEHKSKFSNQWLKDIQLNVQKVEITDETAKSRENSGTRYRISRDSGRKKTLSPDMF